MTREVGTEGQGLTFEEVGFAISAPDESSIDVTRDASEADRDILRIAGRHALVIEFPVLVSLHSISESVSRIQ